MAYRLGISGLENQRPGKLLRPVMMTQDMDHFLWLPYNMAGPLAPNWCFCFHLPHLGLLVEALYMPSAAMQYPFMAIATWYGQAAVAVRTNNLKWMGKNNTMDICPCSLSGVML